MSPCTYAIAMKGKDQGAKFEFRLRVVRWAQEHGVRSATAAFQCSRNTVRKWLRRYMEAGAGGLEERSRAPRNCPHKTPKHEERKIVRARRQASFMGPKRLKRYFGLARSHTTIGRILREQKLTRKPREKHRTKQDLRAVKAQYRALQRLQMDVKYLWDLPEYWPAMTAFGLPRYQYTIRDVKSGVLVLAFANELSTTYAWLACTRFLRHIEGHGVALSEVVVQTDRGSEFSGGRRKKNEFDFTGRIAATGAEHLFIPPRWPNANADVESSHRIIELEFYEPERFGSPADFIRKASLYQHWFNFARLNGYKGGRTPWEILNEDRPQVGAEAIALPPFLIESLFDPLPGVGHHVPGLPARPQRSD